MIKIGLIVDNARYLAELKSVIQFQPDILCSIATTSVDAFWESLPKRSLLDIIFLDIDLPNQSGLEAISALRKRFEHAEIIALAPNDADPKILIRALNAGANGCIERDFPISSLSPMIKTVQNGGALISPRMARMLVEYFRPPQHASLELLSHKEAQLLRLFYEGNTYEESASILGLSIDGVKYHVKNIYRKLNVDNKVDALRVFREVMQ